MEAQPDRDGENDEHRVQGVKHGEGEERPGSTEHGAGEIHGLAPHTVRETTDLRNHDEVHDVGDQQSNQQLAGVVIVHRFQVNDREAHDDVVQNIFGETQSHSSEDALGVLAHNLEYAIVDGLLGLDLRAGLEKDRGFTDVGANVVTDHDDDRGQPERHAPAPAEELLGRENPGHGEQYECGEQVAHRNGGLRPARPEATGLVRAVLGDEKNGAAPLTADGETLNEAQGHEQRRCPVADGVETGQAAHQEGGGPDHDYRHLQGVLAAEFVTDLTEHDATEWPGDEPHRVSEEGGNDAVKLTAGVRKEDRAEDQACGGGV